VLAFGAALFLSAFLMFNLELYVGRLLLPLLGGTPAVWNTCILFFQAVLLGGYAWAHLGHRLLGERRHILLHMALVLGSLLFLPLGIRIGAGIPDPHHPIPWLLGSLTRSVGLPFLVLAATTPLLQRWFSRTTHRSASDPYFLYAASNLGSLAGLLGYPTVVERQLALHAQSLAWTAGYILAAMMVIAFAIGSWRFSRVTVASERPDASEEHATTTGERPWVERIRWLLLAAAPSSLLLGVTTYLTTDIAAIPLLWVVPLSLYLLTFIITFAQPPVISSGFVVRWQPMLAVVLIIFLFWGDIFAIAALLPVHLLAFFATALLCHSALAEARPRAARLTEYYLWIAAGGALGGMFNVLVAPVAFESVLEYPLVLAVACGIGAAAARPANWRDLILPLLGVPVLLAVRQVFLNLGDRLTPPPPGVMALAVVGSCLAAIAFYRERQRPAVFSAVLTVLVLAGYATEQASRTVLLRERNFYGVKRIGLDSTGQGHVLYNGSTKHGAQNLAPRLRGMPQSYYARSGPLGDVFAMLPARRVNVGVIGLGAGGLAAYGRPGERWTFFELDPEVERIARDPRFFTYTTDSHASIRVVLGDGRLSLGHEPQASLDLLVLDAFSSDAIPVHLLTREALRLYLQKLAPGGVLLFHLSNRYLDLEPVLASLAQDAGLAAWSRFAAGSASDFADPSRWAIVARRREDVGSLGSDRQWRELTASGRRVWTDEYSNVLAAMRIF
jgi:SAM-dependent methyltransferase